MSYLKSYYRYIKVASDDTKNLHSIFLAGLLTGVFIVVYLYLVRGIAPPAPELAGKPVKASAVKSTLLESSNYANTSATNAADNFEPVSALRDALKKASTDINNLKREIKATSEVLPTATITAKVSTTSAAYDIDVNDFGNGGD